MARIRPAIRPQIDAEICIKIEQRMKAERYRGSFAAYVEQILDKFADGLLVESTEGPVYGTRHAEISEPKDVKAVKVRRIGVGEQRKTA